MHPCETEAVHGIGLLVLSRQLDFFAEETAPAFDKRQIGMGALEGRCCSPRTWRTLHMIASESPRELEQQVPKETCGVMVLVHEDFSEDREP